MVTNVFLAKDAFNEQDDGQGEDITVTSKRKRILLNLFDQHFWDFSLHPISDSNLCWYFIHEGNIMLKSSVFGSINSEAQVLKEDYVQSAEPSPSAHS